MSALRSKQNLKLMGRDGEAISESTQVAGVALKNCRLGRTSQIRGSIVLQFTMTSQSCQFSWRPSMPFTGPIKHVINHFLV
jgi:hypothetical protein